MDMKGRENLCFEGVRRSIKDYMEKPVLLPKDKPLKTGLIVKSLPSKVYTDIACMSELRKR